MPHSSGYETSNTKDSIEAVLRPGPMTGDGKGIGTIRAKPGAAPHMSRSGAMDGKNPDAQTSKPKKTHTISKALN